MEEKLFGLELQIAWKLSSAMIGTTFDTTLARSKWPGERTK
jgi:hypothetical protein